MQVRAFVASHRMVAVLALGFGLGCSDASSTRPVTPATPPGPASSMLLATVNSDAGTVTFEPLGSSGDVYGSASPQIYGNQNVTVNIHSTSFVIDSTTVPGTKTWSIGVGLRNLLAYPIGANYGAISPLDTMGVYVFFSSLPTVTKPVGCGCSVSVANPMGSRNFTAPNQPFFWYKSRLQAVNASPNTDTTKNNPIWKFTGPKAVTNFTFVLLVSAAWSPPNQTVWSVSYDGTKDSLPDTQGKPRWLFDGINGGGTESWSASGLVLSATSGNDVYMVRNDSLAATTPDVFEATLKVANATNGDPENQFGFGDPKVYMVGVAADKVGFMTWGFPGWIFTGATYTLPAPGGTASHTYRLRKFGSDSAVLCVDGARQLKVTGASLPGINLTGATLLFGTRAQNGSSSSTWTNVSYTIGDAASGCS